MNMLVIDVTGDPGVSVGDDVVLMGSENPALELAELAGTISYEIITRINPWIPRKYV